MSDFLELEEQWELNGRLLQSLGDCLSVCDGVRYVLWRLSVEMGLNASF